MSPLGTLAAGLVAGFVGGYLTRAWLQATPARSGSLEPLEAGRLRDAGFLVAEALPGPALAPQYLPPSPLLAAQVAAVQTEAPGARPVAGRTLKSNATKAKISPMDAEPPALRGTPARATPCAVAVGDELELRVAEVTLETPAGARVVVGTGEVWASGPPPRLVLEAPFSARLSSAVEVAQEPPPAPRRMGPGIGLLAAWGAPGAFLGPLLHVPLGALGPVAIAFGCGLAVDLGGRHDMLGVAGLTMVWGG